MGETSGATSMPQEVSDGVTSESWDLLVLLSILRVPVSASDRGVPRLVGLEPGVLVVTLANEKRNWLALEVRG